MAAFRDAAMPAGFTAAMKMMTLWGWAAFRGSCRSFFRVVPIEGLECRSHADGEAQDVDGHIISVCLVIC